MDEPMLEQSTEGQPGEKIVPRDGAPDLPPEDAALIKRWQGRMTGAKTHWKKRFAKIRDDMTLVRNGCNPREWDPEQKYTLNLIIRHVNNKVADLYAKNPRVKVERRSQIDYTLWDGKPESLAAALEGMAAGDENAATIISEVQAVQARHAMLDKVARAVVIMFHYFMDESEPSFKLQAKQLVRRVVTCGVGWVELGFQRLMEERPEVVAEIADITNRLATIEQLSADLADGEIAPDKPEAAQLRDMLSQLQQDAEIIAREGLTFDFPRTTEIILDPSTKQINGLIGTRWLAREMHMTPAQIQRAYKVDVGKNFTAYKPEREADQPDEKNSDDNTQAVDLACVWRIQDKETGTIFVLCDGYKGYLKRPEKPAVELERFFNVFPLMFNVVENEDDPYPDSDVRLLRHPQEEYNRAREGLREHRIANRPKYAAAAGMFEDEDKTNLSDAAAHDVIELQSLTPGQKVEDLLQPFKHAPIDSALYETASTMDDIQNGVGSQQANIGNVSGATATESGIAESSRMSSLSSNIDDLDDFLSDLARNGGKILMAEMSPQHVKKICGPGAIWPQLSNVEIAEEISLKVKAGSSGRPNRAADLANLERAYPFLLQVPGISPRWLAQIGLQRLDDTIDLEEAFVDGLPSIIAQNAMAGKPGAGAAPGAESTGNPGSDPAAQGGAGGQNAPRADRNERGPQPAFPAPN